MNSPKATANCLMARLATGEFETFTLIYLDNRHRLIACQDLFRGTDGVSVHPREVVKGEPHAGERSYREVRAGPQRSRDSAASRPPVTTPPP